ncbi:MAG: metallophosphoesterase [Oscillospiraceae bacterium]|nr:metallophosphoesterase [Eubacteriales bacterium]MDY2617831.1 metallophosphoesterase [Oscillospiraceae bacterium]
MALYVLGDPHLSFRSQKPMDIFGGAWNGYVDKLREGLSILREEDTIVLAGDISWGMSLEESTEDFAFLDAFPGRKLIVKGNHDYWWTTANKTYRFWEEHGFKTLNLLHNNCYEYGGYALCGTRGWFLDEDKNGHNQKVFNRELLRLETSLKAAGEKPKLVFLHYPPLYQGYSCPEILNLLEQYQVRACYYGHLHGGSHRLALEGMHGSVDYHLVAGDYLGFHPLKICES